MDLHRLKIEHCNAITAELDKAMKMHESMMSGYAIDFMDSSDEEYKSAYSRSKASRDAMKIAIDLAQSVTRDFEFSEDSNEG